MLWADTSSGKPFSKDPSVIRFNQRYLMYFSTPPKPGEARWGQGVAESSDLSNWRTVREIGRGICAADAIVLNGRVHLFYQTYGNGSRDSICHATSSDGVNFNVSRTPIFRPAGAWNNGRAIDAEAHVIGNSLYVYWATRDPLGRVQMLGVHSAPRDSNLHSSISWRQRCTASILKPKLAWEKQCVEAPTICRAPNGSMIMFYAGGYNNQPQQIGVAHSTNGLSWTRLSDRPFLPNGAPGAWNSCESGHPGIFVDPRDRSTWLFFQGNNDMGRTYYISKRQIRWDGHVPALI
jgi:hypothetical protein